MFLTLQDIEFSLLLNISKSTVKENTGEGKKIQYFVEINYLDLRG